MGGELFTTTNRSNDGRGDQRGDVMVRNAEQLRRAVGSATSTGVALPVDGAASNPFSDRRLAGVDVVIDVVGYFRGNTRAITTNHALQRYGFN